MMALGFRIYEDYSLRLRPCEGGCPKVVGSPRLGSGVSLLRCFTQLVLHGWEGREGFPHLQGRIIVGSSCVYMKYLMTGPSGNS